MTEELSQEEVGQIVGNIVPRVDISEDEFQTQVIDSAHLHGWKVAHFRKARTKDGWITAVSADGKGWNDLFCVRPSTGHVFAAELKSARGKRTPEQIAWASWMEAVGIAAYVWKPSDWDEINSVLKEGPEKL
jgi:hypothetical protein